MFDLSVCIETGYCLKSYNSITDIETEKCGNLSRWKLFTQEINFIKNEPKISSTFKTVVDLS